MARKPRIEYAGAVYHVMSRGDRKNIIFRDEGDRKRFIDTLAEACERQGWIVHAYVLMDNHYHLLLETPEPNLVVGMKWLQGTYTQRFNSRYKEWGHLFQGRYKALVVQSGQGDYFSTVATYIHLNPVRAKLMDFEEHGLAEYPWSSFPLYFDRAKRPAWFCASRVLGCYGSQDDRQGLLGFHRMMKKRVMEVCASDLPMDFDERWKDIRRGWCLGDDGFRSDMEKRVDARIAEYDRRSYLGDEAGKHDEHEAERLLGAGLEVLHLDAAQLADLKKSDSRKKVVAWLIRRNTSVKNEWICGRLRMGHPSNLARHVKTVEEATDGALVDMRKMTKKAF